MTTRLKYTLSLLLAALVGCADATPPVPRAPLPRATNPPPMLLPAPGAATNDAGVGGVDASTEASASSYYAMSPMTELANQVTDLALAAVGDKPLPTALPIDFSRPSGMVEAKLNGPLEVIAFAAWVKLVLRQAKPLSMARRADREAKTAAEDGAVMALFLLDRARLRLAGIKMWTPGDVDTSPDWLLGLHDSANELHRAARSGTLRTWLVDDDTLATYGDDFARGFRTVRPSAATLARAEVAARTWPLRAISDGAFFVLVRDSEGSPWLLGLSVEYGWLGDDAGGARGAYVISTSPLVSVRRPQPTN